MRTFHALGLEILRDAGRRSSRSSTGWASRQVRRSRSGWLAALDTAISRLKLDLGVTADQVATDPDAGPTARTFVAYERAVAATGGLDFDDLVARALRLLESSPVVLARWRARCAHLLVDEAQDLDRAQLRLALLLAAPANRVLRRRRRPVDLRLAPRGRPQVLSLADALPGLRRVDLVVNYRCPATVVDRAVRLVEHNVERFAKTIRAGPASSGRIVLARDSADETVRIGRVVDSWPADDGTRAVLARTNRELLPAIAVCLDRRLAFRPPAAELLVGSPLVDEAIDEAAADRRRAAALARLEAVRARLGPRATSVPPTTIRTRLARPTSPRRSSPGRSDTRTLAELRAAVAERRAALAELCRDDAPLTPRHGPRDQGPRVRPRRGDRHGRRPLPEPPLRGGVGRAGASARGGAPPRVCRLDPRPAVAHARLRPARPVGVPARGVQRGRARRRAIVVRWRLTRR